MGEDQKFNPLMAHVMGQIQERGELERAKAAALLAVGQRLDQVLDELRKIRPLVEELVERGRRP